MFARLLVDEIIASHGALRGLRSDTGTNFLSKPATEVCKFFQIHKVNTYSYHPQTDRLVEMFNSTLCQFKVDRPQTAVVAKNLSLLQLFISRMPKMCAILQLVSAPLNPIPIAEHFRRSHPQCEHSCEQHIYMSKENNAKQNEDVI